MKPVIEPPTGPEVAPEKRGQGDGAAFPVTGAVPPGDQTTRPTEVYPRGLPPSAGSSFGQGLKTTRINELIVPRQSCVVC